MKSFLTPQYRGVWFNYSGDRMQFRDVVERHLRQVLADPQGSLVVDAQGPHWQGSAKIELSYSHSANQALLVYSATHQVGVDIESRDRKFNQDALALAKRFFHESEAKAVENCPTDQRAEFFLKLWVKKEAFAKFSRLGIAQTLHERLPNEVTVRIAILPVTVERFLGAIAFSEAIPRFP